MPAVEIEIPSRSAYVGVVRLALTALGRAEGLDEGLVDDVKIAVSEACANAVLANEEADGDAAVTVSWRADGERLEIDVSDRGPVHEPRPEREVDSEGFSTRSLMSFALLSTLADECARVPRRGGGMTTHLVFARRA